MNREPEDKYVLALLQGQNPLNPLSYEVVPVTVKQTSGTDCVVLSETYGEMTTNIRGIFNSEPEAGNHRYRLANDVAKNVVANAIGQGHIPDYLLPNFSPRVTTNPLRMLERNAMGFIQPNTVNTEVSPQKVIQIMAGTVEDIKMIMAAMQFLTFTNDYVKKLLGKYLIIELTSLFLLFTGGHESQGLKDFNNEYRRVEYPQLVQEIRNLEEKFSLKLVRDKVAAHKDSNLDLLNYIDLWNRITYKAIDAYKSVLFSHIDAVLPKYFPHEYQHYFQVNQQSLNGTAVAPKQGYEPFGDFEV